MLNTGQYISVVFKNKTSHVGPYDIKFNNYRLCPGPRSKNLTIASSFLVNEKYGSIAYYNCTFISTSKIEELKVTVWNINGKQKSVLWNYKVNKPCQHFLIASTMQQYFPDMRNCVVPPGEYNYKSNYTDIAYKFFGSSFFYGDFSFKMNAISKQGNIMCIQLNALFSKKA
uniref:MD-2-related lipid-recognition domain-containing protein n=1 Tax=Heliothis virescens TaxID=7102 RepID=A0A2A4IWN2_HELVI